MDVDGPGGRAALRRAAFAGFTVDDQLVDRAAPDAVVLHCLPAHRGEEITAAVIDGPRSLVWQQAANRLHAMRGISAWAARGRGMSGHVSRSLTKNQRQHRIAKLLETHAGHQPDPAGRPSSPTEGIEATQTTVSRDLEDLGAVKVRLPGGETVYALPELPVHQMAPEDHLRRVLGEWVVEVAHSANLVVLRTPPGSAHVVGSALDRSGLEGVVGTVAGDDTVLVVVAEQVGGDVDGGIQPAATSSGIGRPRRHQTTR